MFSEGHKWRAAAKINLLLEVLGKRPDGYHDLRSVVVPISLFDTIALETTDGPVQTIISDTGTIRPEELHLASESDNLATRAAMELKRRTGYPGGARILIEKNIPVGGGLGGGSADAAAVLKSLNETWQTGLSVERLMEIGFAIGCDVPALVHGGAVCMEGVGERVTPLPSKNGARGWWLVVANPGFSVSTADIYGRYTSALTCGESAFKNMASALGKGDLKEAAKSLFNSLQEIVFRKYPLIQIVAETLKKAGAEGVLLCGSGASVFGLARSEEHAQTVAKRVAKELGPPVRSMVARTLPDGVMVAHGPLEA